MTVDQIVLGTAAVGLAYGRNRDRSVMPETTAHRILDSAWALGIRAFDTAEAYGAAPAILSGWLLAERSRLADAEVVTKVAANDCLQPEPIARAIAGFQGARSVTVLSHGAIPEPVWTKFQALVEATGAAAGQSVYTAPEVAHAAGLGSALVQAPGNVVDTRQVDAAHAARVRLDVRSVFLQGVLADPAELAERRVPGIGWLTTELQQCAAAHGLTPPVALLASMSAVVHDSDRIVVGIDAVVQLDDLAAALRVPAAVSSSIAARMSDARHRVLETPGLLDPRTWH
jgi:aryl-alcohol dehydrogenase-like predicted oxidoreductase